VLRFDEQPTRVDVFVLRRAANGQITEEPVPVLGGRIGAIPAGPWDLITVSVNFAVGGSAAYAWRLP
jgi:hypothetical protein